MRDILRGYFCHPPEFTKMGDETMIYLDNSATTRTLPQAAERAMAAMTQDFFNPASAYSPAVAMERSIKAARTTIAGAIGGRGEDILFTSGGTESTHIAAMG
ncbi:MAG: aminotransferase class V-fold PLP-dependent enzyme, partial [Clostridia bacterium]|nr:aminotransferase class V-fold PLP-dependent enzyme [Clostridia bacterium]